jgi:ATP-dependent Clp protease, protease subunit
MMTMPVSTVSMYRSGLRQPIKAFAEAGQPAAMAGMMILPETADLSENPFLLDLGSEINPASTQSILSQLMAIERWFAAPRAAKHKPVKLICNCIGGDLVSMLAIVDQLDSLKAKDVTVETYVTGEAASGAAVIASHGSRGHRYVAPRAHVMLHQSSINDQGGAKPVHEGQSIANHGQTLNQLMLDVLANNIKHKTPRHKLVADTQCSKFFNARQAIDYGLADKIGVPRVEPFHRDV